MRLQPVELAAQRRPQLVGDRPAVPVVQVERVHDLADDVELELGRGAVPDPHRTRVAVAAEVVERRLGADDVPVDAVEDVQPASPAPASVHRASSQVHEGAGLLGEAEPHQRVHREGGVTDPGEAVVPVAGAADRLRQRGGRGGHQRPGGLVDQQLQRQRRPLHHLPVPAPVPGPADPPLPVPRACRRAGPATSPISSGCGEPQRDSASARLSPSSRTGCADGRGPVGGQRHGGPQDELGERGEEEGAGALDDLHLGPRPGVVEGGRAPDVDVDPAADRAHEADELAGAAPDRPLLVRHHEVDDLADEVLAQEPGHEDVRVRQVHLLHPRGAGAPHGEPAAALVVEDRGEHRRGVEAGQAEPVDVAVGGDEGGRVEIADDAVVLDESSHAAPRVVPCAAPSRAA